MQGVQIHPDVARFDAAVQFAIKQLTPAQLRYFNYCYSKERRSVAGTFFLSVLPLAFAVPMALLSLPRLQDFVYSATLGDASLLDFVGIFCNAKTLPCLLGWIATVAADRFYLRDYFFAILKMLSAGSLGLWWLVDFVSYKRRTMAANEKIAMRCVELAKSVVPPEIDISELEAKFSMPAPEPTLLFVLKVLAIIVITMAIVLIILKRA